MSYSSLADEIILQIINLLPFPDLDNFAQINKRTYQISYPRLQPRQALKRNAKFIAARFGNQSKPFNSICRGKQHEPVYSSNELIHLDYLNLNGDLHWLQPMDEATTAEASQWPQYYETTSQERLNELVATGKRLGLEFPPAFLTFIANSKLMERIFLGGDFFHLGPSLVKCNPIDDNNGGGYVITILDDQQGCRYWALYVAPGGYHCVLNAPIYPNCWKCSDMGPYGGSLILWDDHEKYEVYEGIPVACEELGVELAHPNFEAWLAMLYFDMWCQVCVRAERELTEGQKGYMEHFDVLEKELRRIVGAC
jgi:hypothetical protein